MFEESVSGCLHPVDNSGQMLEQGGEGPSPQDALEFPPNLNPVLRGVGVEPPYSSVKVGSDTESLPNPDKSTSKTPYYLDYTANLDEFLPPVPLYPPTRCDPKYIVLQCKCGRRIVPSACMSLDCEFCHDQVGKRRSESVYRRLLQGSLYQRRKYHNITVIYTVFTVPLSLREECLDKSSWQHLRKQAWLLLKNTFGGLYGVEVSHPSGEKDPTKFHPHLNFLWIQRTGFRPYIDVDLLRRTWADVLKVDTSDVYSQYSSDIAKIIHWSNYVTRTFPGNHKWTGPVRWYGKYPRMKHLTECRCSDCGCKFTMIGWVDARSVDDWYEIGMLMGRAPPWERDQDIIKATRRRKNES